MKNIYLLFLFAFPLMSAAQEKDIYDTAAQRMCDYVTAHSSTVFKTQADAEEFFAQGFMESCMPLIDRLLIKENLSSFDQETGRTIGKKVGLKLATMCPKYLELVKPLVKEQLKKNGEETSGTLKGKVLQVIQDGYTYVSVQLADGSQKRLLWLTSFEDAENINNDPQRLIKKTVSFEWKSSQLYYYKSKSFASEKIITRFTLL